MFLQRFYHEGLAQASYLVGCERTGEAVAGAHASSPGLSERRALRVAGMSASSQRYAPQPDGNDESRAQIVLAQRDRRYGVAMMHLKLGQAGMLVNHKRVERLYALDQSGGAPERQG